MMLVGVLLALFVLIALIVGTVFFYMGLRMKYMHRKILNEVLVIAIAMVLCLVLRLSVVISLGIPDTVESGIAAGFYVIYSAIGGLSFEGVDAVADLAVAPILQCFYYGAIVYAAVITLLIISTGVSYELFSFVAMRNPFKRYGAIYIFTDTSEESILLAKDIELHYASRRGKENCAIVFMGNEMEPFDRKNENHRIIMNHGYFYWSYGKRKNKQSEKSLMRLIPFATACLKKDLGWNHNRILHIFALKNDSKLNADESKNSDIIFDDMFSVLQDCYRKDASLNQLFNHRIVFNYYLATSSINYEFYRMKSEEIVRTFLLEKCKCDSEMVNKCIDAILLCFQIKILNEAKLAAENMMIELKKEKSAEKCILFRMPDENNVYRAAVFGFGKKGQYAMKELFIETAFLKVDEDGNFFASTFIADTYDKEMREKSGEFAYKHPMFFCKKSDVLDPSGDVLTWMQNVTSDAHEALFREAEKRTRTERDDVCVEKVREVVRKAMGYPAVIMHEASCFDKDFMGGVDGKLGSPCDKNVNYRSFIITLGADELNLSYANMLIDDFKHEILLNGAPSGIGRKIIFVDIRDEKNVQRLNWSAEDREYFSGSLLVVPFGCREKIWTYSMILDDELEGLYHYIYNLVSNQKNGEEVGKNLQSLAEIDGETLRLQRDAWLTVSPFEKESNRSANSFGVNFQANNDPISEEEVRLEHLRWNRFYMSHGWIYASYEESEKRFRRHNREHTCLCPDEMMDKSKRIYDKYNVYLGKTDLSKMREELRKKS